MKPTQTNADRFCSNCGSGPLTGNARQKFCSANCRTASFRKNQSLTILEQDHELEQRRTIIQELQEAPVKRTETVRKINPERQVAQQAFDAQKARCIAIQTKLAENRNTEKKLTSGDAGASIGAVIGSFLVFTLMSLRYDNREGKSLGVSFLVISCISLITVIFIGYHCGRFIHCKLIRDDDRIRTKLNVLVDERQLLEAQLAEGMTRLEELRQELDLLPQYESETLTSSEETRM